MDINYELILKYLTNKKSSEKPKDNSVNDTNLFEQNQKNIMNYVVTFSDKFKSLLVESGFYRYGVTKNNISFWTSLLTLLDKKFMVPYENDELTQINNFKNQLLELYNKSLSMKDLDKNDIRDRFKLHPDIIVIQYIVDILDINIIIFDFKTDDISTVYKNDIMNPWKQTILLAKYSDLWEPIMFINTRGKIQRLFDYNDNVIKRVLSYKTITYFESNRIKKEHAYNNNISSIIDNEKTKLGIIQINIIHNEDSESSVKTDASDDIDVSHLNKTQLTKLKLIDLTNLVAKLKIPMNMNKPTKSIIITEILKKISL